MLEKRPMVPLSLTLITALLLISGTLSFLLLMFYGFINPALLQMLYGPWYPLSWILLLLGSALATTSGLALLFCRSWGQYVYLVGFSILAGLQFLLLKSESKILILPSLIGIGVVSYLLFQPKINTFLSSAKNRDDRTWLPLVWVKISKLKVRQWFAIPFFLLSAYMVNYACYLLPNMQSTGIVFLFQMFIFIIPLIIAHWIGVALWGGRTWLVSVAIVLLAIGIIQVGSGLMIWISLLSGMEEMIKIRSDVFLNNYYLSTFLVGGTMLIIGILLYQLQLEEQTESPTENTEPL